MANTGVYVYGFVRSAEAPDLGCIGLDHSGAPARVYAVAAGNVASMVSDYDARGRVMPLRRNLDPHDRVIRETLQHTTILPATFGHVARNAQQVAAMLRRHSDAIAGELSRLDAKIEMAVRVSWDVENIFKYMVDRHPVLAELRDRIFVNGQANHEDKLELGRLFEVERDAARTGVVQHLSDWLRPETLDVHVGRIDGDKTAANLAFLVARRSVQTFRDRVQELAAVWPAEYVFQCSGPWAPFNFVHLEIEDDARERRGAA
jgi:hypothetical protein